MMAFKINPSIFRAYDIRGVVSEDLSTEFARTLGLAYAQLLKGRKPVADRKHLTIAVGRDCRLSSKEYADALIEGLLSGGLDVVRLGLCPTPLTYFSLFHLDLDGAIMITASHNPPNQNGFKICIGRDAIYGSKLQELRLMVEGHPQKNEISGSVSDYDIASAYIQYQLKQFPSLKKKKIVIDAGNGMAGPLAPKLLRMYGIDVIELYCELDGQFPNHIPDPTVAKNLVDLIRSVKFHQADFGIGFDGDADRIGIVDENGKQIAGDELLVIFSRAILTNHPGATVVSEVKSSLRLYQDIKSRGGHPIMWKTGHSLIEAKMKETNALLGGELSGHIFFADKYFGFDDAIYAALRLLEITSNRERPLSSLLNDLPITVSTPEMRVPFEDSLKFKLVEEVKRLLLSNPALAKATVTDIDGIRIDFEDGWGLMRASNTQPIVSFRFEALSNKRVKELKLFFEDAVSKVCRILNHAPLKFEHRV
jgi:phosphomannomutase/phosphoglucomutase